MAAITKEYAFEAKHYLPNHKGKCAREHGHSYRALVTIAAPIKNPVLETTDAAMVVDFDELDQVMKPLLEKYLDHWDLNATLMLPRTTAEMIALWIYGCLKATGARVFCVELYETAKAKAVVWEQDWNDWGHLCQYPN